MKAIAIIPGTTNLSLIDRPEPQIQADDEIKIKTWYVGICGTDREIVSGGRADAPRERNELIIGHEMFGQIVEMGSSVTKVKLGDFAVFAVRRGCGQCTACLNNRSDMCYTGNYTERGIKGADGYQAEYIVDKEQYIVKVPEPLKDIGVLTEPMSVAAKAIDEAIRVQAARLKDFDDPVNWLKGKKALVAGMGPIGLMAAFALKIKGAEVIGLDIVDEDSYRPRILKEIGGTYIDGRQVKVTDIDEQIGQIDFVFEAAGIAKLQFQLIDTLGINAIYMATGIPSDKHTPAFDGGTLMQQLVLKNQIVLGSVNASVDHYDQAVHYLEKSLKLWPNTIEKIITYKFPYTDFDAALHYHSADEIKVVIDWRL
ncbi:glucose 1-dehydrogenase [Nitrosomonas sp. Nm166]|uniref:glucose 1-dehydrogenase n=1 Tax=Nitrosomonas sp. Nm166 TaxID=1881054 RepID=UPI0008E6717E|nr:glucose 1-dehydrogenase [Nitrosomonas sp. Nm166]SFE12487.1 Threonine dehydrogenase [Nitrosomonas sp. Nm166]